MLGKLILILDCWIFQDRTHGPGKDVDGKYPARSHEDMPCETEFANSFEDAQLDVERREKNANKRRTMIMWRNAIAHTWETRPMCEIHKLIDRQPKIQEEIIAAEGSRVDYWIICTYFYTSSEFEIITEFNANLKRVFCPV